MHSVVRRAIRFNRFQSRPVFIEYSMGTQSRLAKHSRIPLLYGTHRVSNSGPRIEKILLVHIGATERFQMQGKTIEFAYAGLKSGMQQAPCHVPDGFDPVRRLLQDVTLNGRNPTGYTCPDAPTRQIQCQANTLRAPFAQLGHGPVHNFFDYWLQHLIGGRN